MKKSLQEMIVALGVVIPIVLSFLLMVSGPVSAETINDLREIVTTGSISAGSNQLTVASAAGFQLGDWVIVEIGKEPGQGKRGTRGVGGTWPSTSYPTEAQLLATSRSESIYYAWSEDTGEVFMWRNNPPTYGWYNGLPNKPKTFFTGSYYNGKSIPRSLQARIININGSILTLDKSAAVTVSGANVYLDTAPIITKMIQDNSSVTLPPGDFLIGGILKINNKPNFTFSGSGKAQTRIYSPKGVPSAGIEVNNSPSAVIKDFTLEGNHGDEGFGLNWGGSTSPQIWLGNQTPVTDTNTTQGNVHPRGVFINQGSHQSKVKDIDVIDVPIMAVGTSVANDAWAYRVKNIQNEPMRNYIQWQFQWTDSVGGGCVDCSVVSAYGIPGFESFKSRGVSFIRPKGTNAAFAINGSEGWFIEDADLRFTAGSYEYYRVPPSLYAQNGLGAMVDINNNIAQPPNLINEGGTIRRANIVIEGYQNNLGWVQGGIGVGGNTPRIRIEGGSHSAPDYDPNPYPGKGGSQGIYLRGPGSYVANFRVTGLPRELEGQFANLYMQAPCIQNGGGNAADPRTVSASRPLGSMSFYGETAPAGGCSSVTAAPVVPPRPPEDNPADPSPTVTLTAPASGTSVTVGTAVILSATASDNTGVASVEFRDGSQVIGTDTSAPYSVTWNTANASIGSHSITAIATDSAGNTGYSISVTVNVQGIITPSPNGTRGTTVTDNEGVVWSIDANNNVLRNGVPFNGGWADQLLWWNGIVYHHGVGTKEWYTWNGVTWISHGLTDPQLGTAYKSGDINNDGQITAFDAALAAQASVGLITLTGDQTKAADVNGSQDVTAFDAALIAQYSVGLITKFPAG